MFLFDVLSNCIVKCTSILLNTELDNCLAVKQKKTLYFARNLGKPMALRTFRLTTCACDKNSVWLQPWLYVSKTRLERHFWFDEVFG